MSLGSGVTPYWVIEVGMIRDNTAMYNADPDRKKWALHRLMSLPQRHRLVDISGDTNLGIRHAVLSSHKMDDNFWVIEFPHGDTETYHISQINIHQA